MSNSTGIVQRDSANRDAASSRHPIIALMAFLTVVDLFAAQALLPTLVAHYQVTPAAMGLAVNACTLGMALGSLAVALYGGTVSRRTGIIASLCLLSIPTVLLAFAPNLWVFAALRITQGLCMSVAFGLTLAYLGDSTCAKDTASAFAAYITGNVASNLVGRLIATTVVDHAGLAANFFVFSGLNLAGAGLVALTVSSTQHPSHLSMPPMKPVDALRSHFQNSQLRAAFGIGFCILFAFIGTFTYVNFVLARPPLHVGMMQLGFIYFVFLPAIFTTPLAGRAAALIGTKKALWSALAVAALGLPLMLMTSLTAVMAGMVLVAVGTFFAQALATGYVSRVATANRGAASGIYLASYFTGGLVGAAVVGQLFDHLGWPAAVAEIGAALLVAAILSQRLHEHPEGHGA
jgi:MFS transporter, YNFM family, putative membrane transport protein